MKDQFSRWLGRSERDAEPGLEVQQIPVSMVRANRYQPRSVFDEERLAELSSTIRTHGVIQPIVVRKQDGYYELVAGERRLRAVQRLGMDYIPAIIRAMSDSQAASAALIENLQREELTSIEEAVAYQQLIDLHHLTQESLAQRLGKGQSTVANKLRLLNLSTEVQDAIRSRRITERHARALLALPEDMQGKVLEEILRREWNVKQTEERVRSLLEVQKPKAKGRKVGYSKDVRLAINTIRETVSLIEKTGLHVSAEEHEEEEFVEFVIRVPRAKKV